MWSLLLYPLLIVLYIIHEFVYSAPLAYIIGALANVAIFYALFRTQGLYRISGILFYTIGILLFFYNGLEWHEYFLYFDSMLGILALFLFLPFLQSLIRVGRYDTNLQLFLKERVTNVHQLYKRSFFVGHSLGLFLNIASIPLLYHSLKRTVSQLPERLQLVFFRENLLRAYAFCITWSPLEIMVITSLDITGQSYVFVFPFIFSIVILMIAIDIWQSRYKYQSYPIEQPYQTEAPKHNIHKKARELLLMLLILVSGVSVIDYILGKGYLFSLVLFILPFSIVWAYVLRKPKRYFAVGMPAWKTRTKGLANFFFMFLSAGFFVQMVSMTALMDVLQHGFLFLGDYILLFYIAIALYFLLFSFVGFHPLVSIFLLAEVLQPVIGDVSSISLTIVMITCSLSPVMYSPFNISVTILANQVGLNPYRLGVKNIPFAVFYMSIAIVIAYVLQFFWT
ncbi:hypothetical protein SAMN05192534_10396 [Alteribacillus persepolensis]|uniref:Uncharacterized protein n=1 Tax=Alteribacillus persepolensis TaxID=568899 RepID=A0A1G8B226_9BACI|nr:hypothetical protein [Alteribacillus persepolensis]SDH26670.1 hypothetical protein SAMN05192534_10396 [Alteribacillus persepolensis]